MKIECVRVSFFIFSMVVVAATTTSCGGEINESVGDQASEDVAWSPPDTYQTSSCLQFSFNSPAPGTRFTSSMMLASGEIQSLQSVVEEVDGSNVTYRVHRRLPGMPAPMPDPVTSTRIASLLPRGARATVPNIAYERSYAYNRNIPIILASLSVGQVEELRVVETASAGGESATTPHVFQVELLGCGTMSWGANQSPVRVYRTTTFGQSRQSGSPDFEIRRTVTTTYLADDIGWPIRQEWESGGYEMLESVTLG